MPFDTENSAKEAGHVQRRIGYWIEACKFPGYTFHYRPCDSGLLVWGSHSVVYEGPAPEVPWNTRKWYVSGHSTEGEVAQTILKLVLTSREHEVRESFTYCGRACFGPHLDIDQLLDVESSERAAPTVEGAGA